MALTVGSRLGPYEVSAQIGQGGMGEVYRARDTKRQLDAETGEILATVEVGGEPEGVRASPDGRFVYVTADLTTRSRSSTRPRMRSSSNSKSVHGHGP